MLTAVSVLCSLHADNREDFTISALIQLLEPCNNFFQWKDSNTTYSEKAMRLHSLHRAEVFRVLQGMLNVLYYSVPTQQRVSALLMCDNLRSIPSFSLFDVCFLV
jgi:hypothetical protein